MFLVLVGLVQHKHYTFYKLSGQLNVVLDEADEYDIKGKRVATHGEAFIRGNNVLYISAQGGQ